LLLLLLLMILLFLLICRRGSGRHGRGGQKLLLAPTSVSLLIANVHTDH
jgi:hypothetical protein